MTFFLGILAIVGGATCIWLGFVNLGLTKDLADAEWDAAQQRERADKERGKFLALDAQMSTVLTNLTPLIEQTDWMTGRWGGQFQTLVSMERKRNDAVVKVRKALMDIPAVAHVVATDRTLLNKIGARLP